MHDMACNISFFAIHVDDVARGRAFYETVFGWRFEPWGPPGILGAMHKRREPVEGKGTIGYECSIAVDDIDKTIAAIEGAGGRIGMAKFTIPTVGTGCYFYDTEGNWAGAMQYEKKN
jgi:uncharacterized protein